MNWLIKQIFYLKFLWLKRGIIPNLKWLILINKIPKATFYSRSFNDGQWSDKLPWWDPVKWNTTDYNTYGTFSQMYGKFYFKVKMEPYIIRQPYFSDIWSAIWLTDMASDNDVFWGRAEHPFYYEVDIELLKNDLSYTIHVNHSGGQYETGYHEFHSKLRNRKLNRLIQKDFHLYCIDWNAKRIKMYVNGILCASFPNEIHKPMQIICSHVELNSVIVEK